MNLNKQRSIGAILGYVYVLIQSTVSLIYIPILIQGIGKSEYGLYQLIGSIIAYFAVMEAPMSASVLRFYSEYITRHETENAENTLAIGKRINLTVSAFVVVVSIPCVFLIRNAFSNTLTNAELNEAVVMFVMMIINIIVLLNNYIYIAAITAKESFILLKLLSIVSQVLQPICVCLLIFKYPYALAVVLVQVIFNIIISVIRRYYAIKKLKVVIKYHYFDKVLIKRMLGLSASVLIVALADQTFWKMGQIVIGKEFGTDATAVYSIGAQLNSMYISIGCVVSGMVLPIISRMAESKHNSVDYSGFFTQTGRIQSFILCFIMSGVILFGREFILLVSDETYLDAYYIALLLMLPYTIDLVQNCALPIMQVTNCYRIRAIVLICMATVNTALIVMFVERYGIVGAAVATGLTVLIGSGITMNYVYRRFVNLNIFMFWKSILPIFFVAIAMVLLGTTIRMINLENRYMQFLIHILLYTCLYTTGMALVGLNNDEKIKCLDIIRRIRR